MIDFLTAAFGTGVSGGVIGVIAGIFRRSSDAKERIALAKIELERETAEYKNDREEREHVQLLAGKEIDYQLSKIESENEKEADISYSVGLNSALNGEFAGLDTSRWVDNFRSVIRPGVAAWSVIAFTSIFFWSFHEFSGELTQSDGASILMSFVNTLNFILTSVITFYFYVRNNIKTRV